MHAKLGSLGAYPDNPCYDPGRASWLPYWINNFTEKECDDNRVALAIGLYPGVTTLEPTPPPPAPPPVGVPDIGTQKTGTNVTPAEAQAIQDKLIADESTSWKSQVQKFFTDLADQEANRQAGCNWYQSMNSSNVCQVGGWKLWAVGIGGAAAALYFMVGRRG